METKPRGYGKLIKWFRARAVGLTQKELAERAGITIRTLQNAEDGESVHFQTLEAILKGLSGLPLKIDAFLGDGLE